MIEKINLDITDQGWIIKSQSVQDFKLTIACTDTEFMVISTLRRRSSR